MNARLLMCLSLLALLGLAACGDLPEPFLGNPGANARRLAEPPTPRLAVPPPAEALLSDGASRSFADNLASALQATEVPAFARSAQKTDWQLVARAETRGNTVVPIYVVRDPQGALEGTAEGSPVSAAAWADGRPETLRDAAADAATKVSGLLGGIRTAREKADPNSLYNRSAKVMVGDVTGAPGDGNQSLTRQMRTRLALLGPVVQTTTIGADFIVQGVVKAVPIKGRQQRVEIQWLVKAANGEERGRVVQLNEIPTGSLDKYWGDVAVVVAAEASNGVNDVIMRQSGRIPDQAAPARPDKPANASRAAPAG